MRTNTQLFDERRKVRSSSEGKHDLGPQNPKQYQHRCVIRQHIDQVDRHRREVARTRKLFEGRRRRFRYQELRTSLCNGKG